MKCRSKTSAIKNFALGIVAASSVSFTVGLQADTSPFQFNIEPQSLGAALMELGESAGVEVIIPQGINISAELSGIQGRYTLEAALTELLKGQNLAYQFTSESTVVIQKLDEANIQNTSNKKASSTSVINEIIVTAEKREQNLQEVPVAISAFTADMLESRGITTPEELQFSTPGLSITERSFNNGVARVTLRGIGSENATIGGDPGVPLHINGHYTQSTAYVLRDFLDVERVEVQRGPQGTLYGRNAVGGNINIITKRPTDEFEGMVGVDVGNYNKRQIQAVVSGPLTDRIRGRVAVSDDEHDGYVENVGASGQDIDTSDYTSMRASLEVDVTDSVNLYLNAYTFKDDGLSARRLVTDYHRGPTFEFGPNYYLLNGTPETNVTTLDPFKVSMGTKNVQSDKSKGISMDLSWSFGDMEFRSLTAYDESVQRDVVDHDFSDIYGRVNINDYEYDTLSQEFQLLSSADQDLRWVLGAFYYKEDSFYNLFSVRPNTVDANGDGITDINDPLRIVVLPIDLECTSTAIFGQADYSLNDQWDVIAGLRYSSDKKVRLEKIGLGAGSVPPLNTTNDDDDSWKEYTGKLGINYHVSDDVMIYASWSLGYKAGGFNILQGDAYDPETVDAYEFGLKSRWFGNRLEMNIAAFYYDYQDKQDIQVLPGRGPLQGTTVTGIKNASSATNKGIEVEVQALLTDALTIDATLGYLSAEFDEYLTIDSVFPSLGVQDFSGNSLPFSPEWKFHLGAQYVWTLGGNLGDLTLRGDYSWVDDQWSNGFNHGEDGVIYVEGGQFLPSYHLVNARLQWESLDADWLIALYARNLTDEIIRSDVTTAAYGGHTDQNMAAYFPPRTYGLKVEYKF